jgi:hypothetical protein
MTKAVVAFLRESGSASFQRAYAAFVLSQRAESLLTNADLLSLHRDRDKLGDEGRALITRAEEWMVSQSIKSPARWSHMVAPGFFGVITCQIETSY